MEVQERIKALIDEARSENLSDAWLAKRLQELFEVMEMENALAAGRRMRERLISFKDPIPVNLLASRCKAYCAILQSRARNHCQKNISQKGLATIAQQMMETMQALYSDQFLDSHTSEDRV